MATHFFRGSVPVRQQVPGEIYSVNVTLPDCALQEDDIIALQWWGEKGDLAFIEGRILRITPCERFPSFPHRAKKKEKVLVRFDANLRKNSLRVVA